MPFLTPASSPVSGLRSPPFKNLSALQPLMDLPVPSRLLLPRAQILQEKLIQPIPIHTLSLPPGTHSLNGVPSLSPKSESQGFYYYGYIY